MLLLYNISVAYILYVSAAQENINFYNNRNNQDIQQIEGSKNPSSKSIHFYYDLVSDDKPLDLSIASTRQTNPSSSHSNTISPSTSAPSCLSLLPPPINTSTHTKSSTPLYFSDIPDEDIAYVHIHNGFTLLPSRIEELAKCKVLWMYM